MNRHSSLRWQWWNGLRKDSFSPMDSRKAGFVTCGKDRIVPEVVTQTIDFEFSQCIGVTMHAMSPKTNLYITLYNGGFLGVRNPVHGDCPSA